MFYACDSAVPPRFHQRGPGEGSRAFTGGAHLEMMAMSLIPWRIKNFASEHFPLAYHIAINLGVKKNSQE